MSVVCEKRDNVEDDVRRGVIDCVNASVSCMYDVRVWFENIKADMCECSRGEATFTQRTFQRS